MLPKLKPIMNQWFLQASAFGAELVNGLLLWNAGGGVGKFPVPNFCHYLLCIQTKLWMWLFFEKGLIVTTPALSRAMLCIEDKL